MQQGTKLLVTDFDGTMAKYDFYRRAVERLLAPEDLTPWNDYAAGEISHFESLRRIFAKIRATEAELEQVIEKMQFDPMAAKSIDRLRDHGWEVKVVSNGCGWYIERLFARHRIQVELHTNPGEFSPEHGLQLHLPTESPFFCSDVGVSKGAVVNDAIESGVYSEVAFAGDGRPDLEPALLVSPKWRFAREWLATALKKQHEPFRAFEIWSEIADVLCEESP